MAAKVHFFLIIQYLSLKLILKYLHREGKMGRQGEGEKGEGERWGDWDYGTERWGDGETGRLRDWGTGMLVKTYNP